MCDICESCDHVTQPDVRFFELYPNWHIKRHKRRILKRQRVYQKTKRAVRSSDLGNHWPGSNKKIINWSESTKYIFKKLPYGCHPRQFGKPTLKNQPTHRLPELQVVLLPILLGSLLEILLDHEPAPVLTYLIIMTSQIPADAFD